MRIIIIPSGGLPMATAWKAVRTALTTSVLAVACATEPPTDLSLSPNKPGIPRDSAAVRGGALERVSGDSQATIPRGLVLEPLKVRIVDSAGRPVSGVTVRWRGEGGSRMEATASRSNADGIAAMRWVLGATPGAYRAMADADSASGAFFTAWVDSTIRLEVVPSALRFSSLGETACVRLRRIAGTDTSFVSINNVGSSGGAVVQPVGFGTTLLLRSIVNGTRTLRTLFGDSAFTFEVMVQQVPVGLGIVPRVLPQTDTLGVTWGERAGLMLVGIDALGFRVVGAFAPVARGWLSSNDAVATVDDSGTVTGNADGIAVITARSDSGEATTPLRVWSVRATSLAAGWGRACAALADVAAIACWGAGDASPRLLEFGAFTQLSLSSISNGHACGVRPDGRLGCWGRNDLGQLGSGTADLTAVAPVTVASDARFRAVRSGGVHTCALTTDGAAWCWGSAIIGLLGDGDVAHSCPQSTESCSNVPIRVAGGLTFSELAVGGGHACALTADGHAFCWGSNGLGQLGSPLTTCRIGYICAAVPTAVATELRFRAIAAGGHHTCALGEDGQAYCWGQNFQGQLGNPSVPAGSQANPAPVRVETTERFVAIAAGFQHTCGITEAGAAWCWGMAISGETGAGRKGVDRCLNGSCDQVPVPVNGGIAMRTMALGTNSCAQSASGVVYCWGYGGLGANGDGTFVTRHVPTRVRFQH